MEKGISILVVDDDPEILFATARVLQSAGYEVKKAETGEQCLLNLSEKTFDLVLLDVVLPDMSGHEVCRKIKNSEEMRGTYVLMASGMKTSSDDQSEGLETGADGYFTRPIANRELLARIQAMVRIINAERERDRLIKELKDALANVKTLRGLLPICASCKKIRDDRGYWTQVEVFIGNHSEADFSHGICPDCMKKLYPDFA
ncbi:MAG: DNA-binding response regulator [Desulfobacteraceae bacterium]|jgi:DNA-binding response OmpR family regulator|nr:MAG: DNA-binding response regulator [Desulfobacteraceae bacterium]